MVGIAGTALSDAERDLFARMPPAGFILFARNCRDPEQVTSLIQELRSAAVLADPPVLIDQEGGRVARLKPPHWQAWPPVGKLGELAALDLDAAKGATWLHARLIASELALLGITVNCSPVLDLSLAGRTEAIGDRAFSGDPEIVATLGRAAIQGYLHGGILPVIKHLPGHGRATVDSHVHLPSVDTAARELAGSDWLPFIANADAPFGMTAHMLFTRLDPIACCTQSASIIEDVIRGEIGFAGALFSDDLSMEALGGSLGQRAAAAREAGCDLALHCNGRLDEMTAVLDAAGPLIDGGLQRLETALARRRSPEPFDEADGRRRLEALLAPIQPRARRSG